VVLESEPVMQSAYRYTSGVPHPKPPRPRHRVSYTTLFLAGLATLTLLILLGLLVFAFLYLQVFGLILPGIQVGDIPLGGMNREKAAHKLDQAWNHNRSLIISDGTRVWSASPADFGLWIDTQSAVEQAYQFGRGPAASSEIRQLISGNAPNYVPIVRFFPEIARPQLERWAPLIQMEPQEAALVYEDGQWQALPGKNGIRLDIPLTLQHIQAEQTQIAAGGFLQLTTVAVLPQVADLSNELQDLQARLYNPVTLQAYDPIMDETIQWSAAPEQFGAWLRLGQQDGQPVFTLDREQLNQYLHSEQARLGPARSFQPVKDIQALTVAWQNGQPLDVEIRHDPTQYTVQQGDTLVAIGLKVGMPYWKILEGNPSLNANSTLSTGQTLNIPSKSEMLPLPIVPGKRIIINISQQRLWTYENGSLRSEEVISTGIDRSPTHPGIFQVQTHEQMAYASVWDLYMPHFLGIYEGWPGFMNGLHGLPTLSNGNRMWANSLGRKASYGCIILNLQAAEDLYHWAENGVVVEIQP
jgi:lipoprotein-anchoring transpeptidase ErfK/SrfK